MKEFQGCPICGKRMQHVLCYNWGQTMTGWLCDCGYCSELLDASGLSYRDVVDRYQLESREKRLYSVSRA